MLYFCESCRKITHERDMYSDDVCLNCHEIEADERRTTTEESKTEKPEASPESAEEVENGPFLPGFVPDQGEEHE